MSKISDLSDGGVIQGGDTLIAVRSGGNVKVTYGGSTTANIDGGTIDGTTIGGTTPAAGNFTTGSFTGNVSFGDNDKAIFGAGSDLQIYHSGAASIVGDFGTGDLLIRGENLKLQNTAGENYLVATNNDATRVYYDNAEKLATTSTGIDVTGTVTADGLTVDGSGDLGTIGNGAFNAAAALGFQSDRAFFGYSSSQNALIQSGASKGVAVEVNSDTLDGGTRAALFASNGDVSFYEDTGTTAKFFWDASAESLGIGTSSPSASYGTLTVAGTGITINEDNAAKLQIGRYNASNPHSYIKCSPNSSGFKFSNASDTADLMVIENSGRVGIGTSSPSNMLHVKNPDSTLDYIVSELGNSAITAGNGAGFAIHELGSKVFSISYERDGTGTVDYNSERHVFNNNADTTEYMRIDSSGRVGIGTDSPSSPLHIKSATDVNVRFDDSGSSSYTWYMNDAQNLYIPNVQLASTHTFYANGQRKVDIDASGNLLVGKTSLYSTDQGIHLDPDGTVYGTRPNNASGVFNRKTSDGNIVIFEKDGTTVGSIGSYSGSYLTVGNNTSGLAFLDAGSPHSIRPHNVSTNVHRDDAIDLGSTGARFKNLYLSGGAYLGGTGSANKLDDYEEGTWTPTLIGATSGSATIGSVAEAKYTKIGNLVHVTGYCSNVDLANGTISGAVQLGGLPFSAVFASGMAKIYYSSLFTASAVTTVISAYVSGSSFSLLQGVSQNVFTDSDLRNVTNAAFMIDITYLTNS